MGIIKSYSEYLNESFWGDVHKRSRGDEMRREDAVTYKDLQREDATIEQLYRYLTQHYTPIAKMEGENPINDITTHEDQIEVGKKSIIIPLTTDGKFIEIEPVFTSPDEILFVNAPSEFSKLIKNDGVFTRYRYGQPDFKGMSSFHREEKEIRKSDAVDLLDKLLAYVDNPILKKRSPLGESFWGDVHKRSRGDEIRQEDELHTNDLKMMQLFKFIKERHPILDQYMDYGAVYLPDYKQISLVHYGGKRKGGSEGDFDIKYTRKKKENELVVLVPGGWDTYHKLMDCIKPTKQFTTKTLMEDPNNYIHVIHFKVFQKDKSPADNNLFVRLVDCILDGLGE